MAMGSSAAPCRLSLLLSVFSMKIAKPAAMKLITANAANQPAIVETSDFACDDALRVTDDCGGSEARADSSMNSTASKSCTLYSATPFVSTLIRHLSFRRCWEKYCWAAGAVIRRVYYADHIVGFVQIIHAILH